VIVIGAVALVLAALGVIGAVDMGRGVNVTLDGFGVHTTTTVLWVFVAGAVAMLLLVISLAALRRGMRKRRAKRRELKQLRRDGAGAHSAEAPHDSVDLREDDPSSERRYVPGSDRAD
jgi:uncharacterized membrane protein